MSIADDVAKEMGLAAPSAPGEDTGMPSSFNPLTAYPYWLKKNVEGASRSLGAAGKAWDEGSYAKSGFHGAMGGLQGVFAPATSAVQLATGPAAYYSGIPEEALTTVAMLGGGAGAAARGVGKAVSAIPGTSRLFRAGEGAAPEAEAVAAEPRIGATNRAQWEQDYAKRKQAYQEGVGARRGAQMEDAASRWEDMYGPRERAWREMSTPNTTIAQKQLPYMTAPWEEQGPRYGPIPMGGVPPRPPMGETMAPGTQTGGFSGMKPWQAPGPAEQFQPAGLIGQRQPIDERFMMPGRPQWQQPQPPQGAWLMPDESGGARIPGAVEGSYRDWGPVGPKLLTDQRPKWRTPEQLYEPTGRPMGQKPMRPAGEEWWTKKGPTPYESKNQDAFSEVDAARAKAQSYLDAAKGAKGKQAKELRALAKMHQDIADLLDPAKR